MSLKEYMIDAYDANGNWLDSDFREDGYWTYVDSLKEMFSFIGSVKSGNYRDLDAETVTRKRIAYFIVTGSDIDKELHVTKWGRKCNVAERAMYGHKVGFAQHIH